MKKKKKEEGNGKLNVIDKEGKKIITHVSQELHLMSNVLINSDGISWWSLEADKSQQHIHY